MLRFDANLSFLFGEAPFYERFALAREAGFSHIEFLNVFNYDLETLKAAVTDAGLHVVQFNFMDGDMPAGERGFASHPDQRAAWRAAFTQALDIARQLEALQMHSLAGVIRSDLSRTEQLATPVSYTHLTLPTIYSV